jgi:hypothetical protein
MPADGSVDGVITVNTATASSGNKRKRVANDNDEVPKAKRGTKAKEEKAKAEPKEDTKVEDVYEEDGEAADAKEETDQINEEVGENFDEGDGIEV